MRAKIKYRVVELRDFYSYNIFVELEINNTIYTETLNPGFNFEVFINKALKENNIYKT